MVNNSNKTTEDIDEPTLQKLREADGIPKFTQICRACLCETNENDLQMGTSMDLLEKSKTIRSFLEESTGVPIFNLDFLPNDICDRCLNALEAWYRFRSHTQRSNEILKKYMKKLSTSLDKETFPRTDLAVHVHGKELKIVPTQNVCQIENFNVTVVNDKPEIVKFVFHCDTCSMTFTNEVDSEKHQKSHKSTKSTKAKAFKCERCDKSFASRTGLDSHIESTHIHERTHIQERTHNHESTHIQERADIHERTHKFKCDLCEKNFGSEVDYKLHTNNPCVSPALLEQYKICPLSMSLEELLATTEKAISVAKCTCIVCKKIFKSHDALDKHFPQHEDNLQCSICQKDFRRVKVLETHVRKHLHEKASTCPICSRSHNSNNSMVRHLMAHSKRVWVYKCNVCNQEFFAGNKFEVHMQNHLQAKDSLLIEEEEEDRSRNIIECDNLSSPEVQDSPNRTESDPVANKENSRSEIHMECEASYQASQSQADETNPFYINASILNVEICEQEDSVKLVNPELCDSYSSEECCADGIVETKFGESSDDDANLCNEKYSDEYLEIVLDKCILTCHVPDCYEEFSTYFDMWNHFSKKHLPEQGPFKCCICFEEFKYRKSIHLHIKRYYSFKCPICKKVKDCSPNLKIHVKNAHSQRTFECSECGKHFANGRCLRGHELIHDNLRKFVCKVCSKCYISQSGLTRHLRGHENEKELQCSKCNKQFFAKNHLKRHLDADCRILKKKPKKLASGKTNLKKSNNEI